MSDHGWDILLQIVTAIIAALTAWLANDSAKSAKEASDKTDELMRQNMRSILMRIFTGQVEMPISTTRELYTAYIDAGGNHEVKEYAEKYFERLSGKENDEPKEV